MASQAGKAAIERFIEKCHFDATTGCVIWNGALTNGKGSSAVYGRFWDDGKSWYAHRWAAKHIHGLDIDQPGTEVDHCCERDGKRCPNSLCVEHLQVVTKQFNLALIYSGSYLGEPEPIADDPLAVPFYEPPEWFKQFALDDGNEGTDDDCPF